MSEIALEEIKELRDVLDGAHVPEDDRQVYYEGTFYGSATGDGCLVPKEEEEVE